MKICMRRIVVLKDKRSQDRDSAILLKMILVVYVSTVESFMWILLT